MSQLIYPSTRAKWTDWLYANHFKQNKLKSISPIKSIISSWPQLFIWSIIFVGKMFRFMILFTLLLVGHTAWASKVSVTTHSIIIIMIAINKGFPFSKDPVDVVVNAFCGDIELVYPRPDACYACTQKLANMVYMLYRKQGWNCLSQNYFITIFDWILIRMIWNKLA